jgi:F-type H+-transporting ATPase subunit a
MESGTSFQAQPIQHETTLFAEPIFKVGGFTVTNSLINSFFVGVVLVLLLILAGRKAKTIPRGLQNLMEMILEEALDFTDSITGSRKKTEKILPIVLTLFLFILINNWLGLLPFVGTMGKVEVREGNYLLVPFLRGGTADLNTTLALAIFAVVGSHIMGMVTVGIWNHLNKFINFKAFLEIPKKISKDKTVIFINPIKAFVGIIEIIGEIAKVASLSLRLFGNIFAGEVLIGSMMALAAFLVPIPFYFLEILVGVVQAAVFAILTLVFLSMAMTVEEH